MATKPTKIVKGGFRATLALTISLFALVLSILAYTSTVKEEGLKAQVKDLRATIEKIKTESAEQLERLRNETAKTLEKASQIVKMKEGTEEQTEGPTGEAKD